MDKITLGKQTYLTIKEAAYYLNIPESTFRKLVAMRYKKIPVIKIGKRIIFKRTDLEAWTDNLREV